METQATVGFATRPSIADVDGLGAGGGVEGGHVVHPGASPLLDAGPIDAREVWLERRERATHSHGRTSGACSLVAKPTADPSFERARDAERGARCSAPFPPKPASDFSPSPFF